MRIELINRFHRNFLEVIFKAVYGTSINYLRRSVGVAMQTDEELQVLIMASRKKECIRLLEYDVATKKMGGPRWHSG
jgi:hypothetical protein